MGGLVAAILKAGWKPSRCYSTIELPAKIAKWLLFPGSFTKRVQNFIKNEKMHIHVLREDLEIAKRSSYEFLLFNCRYIYAREIQIFLGSHLAMYARSVIPKDGMLIYKRQFRGLGRRPLGNMLFSSDVFTRSPFEIAKIMPSEQEFHLALSSKTPQPHFLWARRSVFSIQQEFLLLNEVFSPDFLRLISENDI